MVSDRLDVGHFVRSKRGAGQPVIEGTIKAIVKSVAYIEVHRIGGARVKSDYPLVRVRSLSNLERSEL